jgi:hypothetical protein
MSIIAYSFVNKDGVEPSRAVSADHVPLVGPVCRGPGHSACSIIKVCMIVIGCAMVILTRLIPSPDTDLRQFGISRDFPMTAVPAVLRTHLVAPVAGRARCPSVLRSRKSAALIVYNISASCRLPACATVYTEPPCATNALLSARFEPPSGGWCCPVCVRGSKSGCSE